MTELKFKIISKSGIAQALSKAELYRYLSEPEEKRSQFAATFLPSRTTIRSLYDCLDL